MRTRKVRIDEKMSRDLLALHLQKMAVDLENGRLEVLSKDRWISFSCPEFIPFELEARQKENKERIVVELSWWESAGPEENPHERRMMTAANS